MGVYFMKGKVTFFIILLIIALVVLPTFSFVMRELIEVYQFSFDKLPDNYVYNTVKNLNTYKSFVTVFDPPNVISWLLLLYLLYSQLIGSMNVLKINKKFDQKDTYGSHGTSRWQTKHEINNHYYKDNLGWFIGSYERNLPFVLGMSAGYLPVNGVLNMQITVIGSPGSIKTTGLVLNNIFHIPYAYKLRNLIMPDLILTDPKSELCSLTYNNLESMGYEVRVLDFIHLKFMDTFNPLAFVSSEKEIIELGEGYVHSVGGTQTAGRGSGDTFWDDAESQLLSALIGYVLQALPKEQQTLTKVAQILSSDSVSNPDKAKFFFAKAGVTGAALQLWNNFLMAEDRVRANILIGLATKLRLFAISGIQNITNTTTLDITKIGAKKEKPIALFIFMPDGDRTFSPVINVVVTTILKQLYKTAYKYNNVLYNDVYFILEEMANIGKITGLSEMLGTMRGRHIYPMMIWQSLSQMKQRYPDGWEDILSMCDTHLYLGVNDEFTAKYASNAVGDTTINIQGTSRNFDGVFGVNRTSESQHYQSRKLIQPEEVKRFDNNMLIMSQRSLYPVKLYKVQYKYWMDNLKICDKTDIFSLPLMKVQSCAVDIENVAPHEVTDKAILRPNFNKRDPERNLSDDKDDIVIYKNNDIDFQSDISSDSNTDTEINVDTDSDVMFTIEDINKDHGFYR